MLSENVKDIARYAFYGAKELTIYAEAESCPKTWRTYWNASYRPVFWGCTLSQSNSYVVSFTSKENAIINVDELILPAAPTREGYTCIGWTTEMGGETAEYTAETVVNAPVGTVLYTVWTKGEPVEEVPQEPAE